MVLVGVPTVLQFGQILEPFAIGGPHSRWADLYVTT